MNELRLIALIWKYALPTAVVCAVFSPSKVGLPTVVITGATISTVVLAPKNQSLEKRVQELEASLIKGDERYEH